MHNNLVKTFQIFSTGAAQGGSFRDSILVDLGSSGKVTLGDVFALDYLNIHSHDVSAGDGTLDRFYIYSKHFYGNEDKFQKLQELMTAVTSSNSDLSSVISNIKLVPHDLLLPIVNFQTDLAHDANYTIKMEYEASLVFWLQVGLIIITLLAYPFGIYKMAKIKHNKILKYNALLHKRMIIEYLLFLIVFICIDAYALYLLFAENVPLTFWNSFTAGSMAVPTSFAIGSLLFLFFIRKEIIDPENMKPFFKHSWFKKTNS